MVYIGSLAPGSRRTITESLNIAADILSGGIYDAWGFPWWEIKYQHTTALRTLLSEKYAPATCNKIIAAVRRVLIESMRLGLMLPEDCAKSSDIKRVKGSRELSGRALTKTELTAIQNAIAKDSSPRGIRDLAIFHILMLGLRRSEVANLKVSNYNPTQEYIYVESGKGNKDRIVFLSDSAKMSIASLLGWKGFCANYLFTPISKGGRCIDRQLTPDGIATIIINRGKSAAVESFSLHDFRRTFISNLFDANVDISTIQKLVGHADPATTIKYDRRGDDAKKIAICKLEEKWQSPNGL